MINFILRCLGKASCTISQLLVEFLKKSLLFIRVQLIHLQSIVHNERTCLVQYLFIHVVVLLHLQNYRQVFLHHLSRLTQV